MEFKIAVDEVKREWRDFLPMVLNPAKERVNGEPSYICPFCGHGAHGDGLTFNPDSKNGTGLKCFGSCQFSGSDIDLYAKMNGRDPSNPAEFVETVKEMAGMLAIVIDDDETSPQSVHTDEKQTAGNKTPADPLKALKIENTASDEVTEIKPNTPGLYTDFIEQAARDLFEPEGAQALEYLHNRGMTDDTIRAYRLGYSANDVYFAKAKQTLPAIIFPHNEENSYFSARSIEGKYFTKPSEKQAGKQPIFNPSALYGEKPCFICESALDALAIIQSGGNAAALIGVQWESILLPQLDKRKPPRPLILSLDNDPADAEGKSTGKDSQKALALELEKRDIPYINAEYVKSYEGTAKDANDLLRADPAQLRRDVSRIEKQATKKAAFTAYRLSDYLNGDGFSTDIDYFRLYKERKTGFRNIDKHLTLYPGMAALGGAASLGKTTFCVNLADNLVKAGETVLYFSLEQETIEIATKSLTRALYEKDPLTPLENVDIKNGATSDTLDAVKREYAKTAERFIIVRCTFKTTAEDIINYIETFIKQTGTRPVVIIDYLQLISPPADYRGDERGAVDNNIKAFKTLQTENELFLILVSSYNRANYETPASYEDFKESGMIEYTCDYVWALQLSIMETDDFYRTLSSNGKSRETTKKEKNNMVNAELKKLVRPVEFVSLKSRNGKQRYEAFFKYDVRHDCFIPESGVLYAKDPEKAANEFNELYPAEKVRNNKKLSFD